MLACFDEPSRRPPRECSHGVAAAAAEAGPRPRRRCVDRTGAVTLPDLSGILLTVLAAAVKADWVDARTTAIQDLWRCTPPLTVRQLIRAVHLAERTAVGELLIDDSIGVNIESWQLSARAINAASVEIIAVIVETHGARPATSLRTSPSPPRGCAVVTLLRAGDLSATRRGRHLCIERDAIESFRHRD